MTTYQCQILIMSIQLNIDLLVDGSFRLLMEIVTTLTNHFV
jgi:hypothetical protein